MILTMAFLNKFPEVCFLYLRAPLLSHYVRFYCCNQMNIHSSVLMQVSVDSNLDLIEDASLPSFGLIDSLLQKYSIQPPYNLIESVNLKTFYFIFSSILSQFSFVLPIMVSSVSSYQLSLHLYSNFKITVGKPYEYLLLSNIPSF